MSHPNDNAFPGNGGTGLSKREYIATKLFAVLGDYLAVDDAARLAVKGADALIAELNK